MEYPALAELSKGVKWGLGLVIAALSFVVVLGFLGVTVAPVWGALVALATGCAAFVDANGVKLLIFVALLCGLRLASKE